MTLQLVAGAALLAALVWRLHQLTRTPHDLALRAVTACLALMAAGLPLQWLAAVAVREGVGAPGSAKLVQNLVLISASWCLMLFFLFSAEGAAARRRARWEVLPLVAAALALTISMFGTPVTNRNHTFATADMQLPGVAGFYFSGGCYFIYVLSMAGWWAWQYAAESDRRMRLGLRVASVGLGISVFASTSRAVFVIIRWAGGSVPASTNSAAAVLVTLGGLLFLLGVLYPALMTRAAAVRVWLRHRRIYHELRPLWNLLHEAYPEGALDHRPRSLLRDRLSPRRMHRRYWRRVVEIRDGLVQLSPHLADVGFSSEAPAHEQVDKIGAALRRQHDGVRPQSSSAVLVAAPARGGADADVEQLVRLARALR